MEMAVLLLIVLIGTFHGALSEDLKTITAAPGQNITLPCRAPDPSPVLTVEWDRTDLGSDYVLLFRDKKLDPELQPPSFQNRVDLQDRQMKNGDVSLMLNNVRMEDSGTYLCRVFSQTKRNKRSVLKSEPLSTIQLQVSPGGPAGGGPDGTSTGPSGLVVGLVVSALIVVLMIPAVIIIIVKKRLSSYPSPPLYEAALGTA